MDNRDENNKITEADLYDIFREKLSIEIEKETDNKVDYLVIHLIFDYKTISSSRIKMMDINW